MKTLERPHEYQAGYLIGAILIGVAVLRSVLFYQGQRNLYLVLSLLLVFSVFFALQPFLSKRFGWYIWFYVPVQTAIIVALSVLRPFLDFQTVLYFPICIQIFRTFSQRAALRWATLFIFLLALTVIAGVGWWEGFAFILLNVASGIFLISYDSLYLRTQAEEAKSQALLEDLQSAHQRLQEHAAQANELAAARERNRLARELHDSVSQIIFSISLTSRSARLLLERDPAQVPLQVERLQEMASSALGQLRSLIAELRPH